MKRLVLAALLIAAATTPARAQVHVGIDIGIHLPGPPALVVVPGAPVYYAPRAPANLFFYSNQYWAFVSGVWYAGPTWNGPWVVVQPAYVPAPILHVPVRYYHVSPPPWKGWHREAPPRWEPQYGREWHEQAHERNWREREEHWSRGDGKGKGKGKGKER